MEDTFYVVMNAATVHPISIGRSGSTEAVNTIMALPQHKVDEFVSRMSDRAKELSLGSLDYMKTNLKVRWGVSVINYRRSLEIVEEHILLTAKKTGPESVDSERIEHLANELINEFNGSYMSINSIIFHLLADDPDVQEVLYYNGEKWTPPGWVTLSISEVLSRSMNDED